LAEYTTSNSFALGNLQFYGRENAEKAGQTKFYARAHGSKVAKDDPFATISRRLNNSKKCILMQNTKMATIEARVESLANRGKASRVGGSLANWGKASRIAESAIHHTVPHLVLKLALSMIQI
jgi:hypothetical protein